MSLCPTDRTITPSQSELQTLHFREFFHPVASIEDYDARVAAIAYLAGLLETSAMGKFALGEAGDIMDLYCSENGIGVDSKNDRRWLAWDAGEALAIHSAANAILTEDFSRRPEQIKAGDEDE